VFLLQCARNRLETPYCICMCLHSVPRLLICDSALLPQAPDGRRMTNADYINDTSKKARVTVTGRINTVSVFFPVVIAGRSSGFRGGECTGGASLPHNIDSKCSGQPCEGARVFPPRNFTHKEVAFNAMPMIATSYSHLALTITSGIGCTTGLVR
jgi:hypothetical protein